MKEKEIAARLANQCSTLDEINESLKQIFKYTIEAILQHEMDEHLGYNKHSRTDNGNSRNGYSIKIIKSNFGDIEINIPRDRNGEFIPKILTKYTKLTPDMEKKIIELYTEGYSTREISAKMLNEYNINISAGNVSVITERIFNELYQKTNDKKYCSLSVNSINLNIINNGKAEVQKLYYIKAMDSEGNVDITEIIHEKEIPNLHEYLKAKYPQCKLTELQSRWVYTPYKKQLLSFH